MYAFAVLGDDAEDALGRLLPVLDGRVGTVRLGGAATDGGRAAGDGGTAVAHGDTEYVLDDGWEVSGEGMSLREALDRLAPDHEYAAVLGGPRDRSRVDVPRIVVGESDEDALVAVDRAADLDASEAVGAIDATEPYETLESLVASVKRSPDAEYAGAIATFTGRVRAKEDEGDDRTRYLEFEKYDGLADERMRAIESELTDRDGVLEVRLHHRTGRIHDGEDIVFVVVLAGHREEAFRTVEDGIDRLKDEVPLFKKEVTEDETFWVHERDR